MSLKVWLPLLGNLDNQGISNTTVTNNGATVNTSGKIGSCYSFDGTDDFLTLNNFNPNGWSEISISAWVYPTATFDHLFLFRGGGAHRFKINASGVVFRDTNNTGTQRTVALGQTIPTNAWTHITCVYKHGEIWIYQNGIQTAHSSTYYNATSALLNDLNEYRIARAQSSSSNGYYTGKINDFRIYDHSLSAKEVKEISKGLVLHYQLDSWAPDGYNRLEYIESQGQILDLQTSQAADICYEFTAWCSSNKANYLFGSKQFSSMAYNGMYRITGIELNYQSQTLNSEVVAPSKITLYQSITDNVITNVLNGKTTTHSIGNLNANDTGTICFFGIPNATPRYYGDTVRLYWLKIKNASGIVRNLIPVQRLSDGTVGMYDLKNSAFLSTNISTSVTSGFIAGPTVGVPGTTVYDCSGYKHDGTLVGTISTNIVSPRYTSSIDLVNGNSMINCGRGGMVTDALTVNFWCYSISGNRPASCTEGAGWNFEPSNNNIQFQVYQAGVGYCGTGASPIVMSSLNNAWHMYTGVYDRLNSKSKLYIDGELAIERTFDGTGLIGYHNTNVIWIGGEATASATTGSAGTAGYFSDFRIYSTALSVTDIQELYNVSMEIDANGNVLPRMLN